MTLKNSQKHPQGNPYQLSFEEDFSEFAVSERGRDEIVKERRPILLPFTILAYEVILKRRMRDLKARERPLIQRPQDAVNIFSEYFSDKDREHLVCLIMDTKNRVIGANVASVGTLDSSLVSPREVLKPLILANAASFIIAHNHPSGDPTPSQEDITVTHKLREAGKLMGIELLDHVILGSDGRWLSLKELKHF